MAYEDWTAAQESQTVSVDQHELEVAYYDEGSGPVVVFLHGIPTSSFLWRQVAPELEDDYRVIAPDMVGYGNSAMYDGFDRSIRAQEEVVAGLVDELGVEQFSFVGHDLGGGVGLRYAAHRPETVENLVLSNAVCYDSWPIETILELGLPSKRQEMSVDDVQGLLDGIFRDTLHGEADEAFVDGMTSPWQSEEGVTSLSRNAIGTNTSHTTEIDPGRVTARTLLLWGANDEFQPISYAERLKEDIQDAEIVDLDEGNHWVMEDQPERYRKALASFLDGE